MKIPTIRHVHFRHNSTYMLGILMLIIGNIFHFFFDFFAFSNYNDSQQ